MLKDNTLKKVESLKEKNLYKDMSGERRILWRRTLRKNTLKEKMNLLKKTLGSGRYIEVKNTPGERVPL